MSTPAEKLAASLKVLQKLQKKGSVAIRSRDLTETHRKRLIKNGFLQEVMKGWYIPTYPENTKGDSTTWYTSFWSFCTAYLNERFKGNWCLSAEQSILLHVGNRTIPKQLLVRSTKANNKVTNLPYNTSILEINAQLPNISKIDSLQVYPLDLALVNCSCDFYKQNPIDMRAALMMIQDSSKILSLLLERGHSIVAGRLVSAFREIGKIDIADNILQTMRRVDYNVREINPFQEALRFTIIRKGLPCVKRLHFMWEQMRGDIIDIFSEVPISLPNAKTYLENIEKNYTKDAYNSLSIEGYRVSSELIEKVHSGKWNPDINKNDREHCDALAARGYWQAYQKVKQSVADVLKGQNAGTVALRDHGVWYKEMFAPNVTAGIVDPTCLAGYRNTPVYIRKSMHIPPDKETVCDLMSTFFDLIREEKETSVGAVLGHFIFVYIHPYIDGNGRIGRFLMNVMCASGGYPWIVIPVEKRDLYMSALEKASVKQNIRPFASFLLSLTKETIQK